MKDPLFETDILSLFSHEIKTPLNSFQLGLSLLEKDFEKNKDIIPLLKSEIHFLSQFIQNILDLRFIQNKKEGLFCFSWVSFSSLLEQAHSSLKLQADAKAISFEQETSKEIEIFTDPLWMSCVLKNLLSNAIQYSFKKSNIQIQYHKDQADSFVFSIKNHSSIKVDTHKIFDLFWTKNSNPKEKGTGIGLNLAQSIIKAHKGEIKAKKQGEKLVFSFSLPKARLIKKVA